MSPSEASSSSPPREDDPLARSREEDDPPEALGASEAAETDTDSEDAPAVAEPAPPPPEQSAFWLVGLVTFFFLLGVHDFLRGAETNGCSMTFMYEYPLFLPIKLDSAAERTFPNYNLTVYGEGEEAEALKAGRFEGIPVLFIPGNSGSHKQVRSLASVALRKALHDDDNRYQHHLDYFAVDFNEEFSALYGGSLDQQTRFLALCIDKVLSLYQGRQTSLVLIGHSIGGMLARSLLSHDDFDANKVSTLVTLATPHQPVVVFDWHTRAFYDHVDAKWNATRGTKLRDVTFVSVGGGLRDIQVRSGLTVSPHADVNMITSDTPGIWVSADHRCIAWCKQLVLTLNRALFDTMDLDQNRITADPQLRRDVFRYHLKQGTTGKHYYNLKKLPKTVTFDLDNGFWTVASRRQFTFSRAKTTKDSHVMVKILDDPKHKFLTVDGNNLDQANWLFGCKASTIRQGVHMCQEGHDLSHLTHLLPSRGRRRTTRVNLHQLARDHGFTHVVVFVSKGMEDVKVMLDVYNDADRNVAYEVPRFISGFSRYPVVQKTAPGAVFYNISLQSMDQPWQAYHIRVTPASPACAAEAEQTHYGLMRFVTEWGHDATQSLIWHNQTNQQTAKLQTPKSLQPGAPYQRSPEMHLYLNPACQYKVEIQAAVPQMWGQMVRFYYPLILPFAVAVVLLTFAQQIRMYQKDGHFSSFLFVLYKKASPVSVVAPGRLLNMLFTSVAVFAFLPKSDFQRLVEQDIDFGILPVLLFFATIGLVAILAGAGWLKVVLFGRVANQHTVSYLTNALNLRHQLLADAALGGASKFPFIVSAALIALAAATCGALSLCLGTFLYFLQLFNLYKDYLKSLVKDAPSPNSREEQERERDRLQSAAHFQFSLLLLWALATLLNAPSLLAWTRNMPLVPQLNPDPSLYTAVILAATLSVTWGDRAPKVDVEHYGALATAINTLAILVVMYGSVSVYRVNYFLSLTFVLIALHQLMAPKLVRPEGEEELSTSTNEATNGAVSAGSNGTRDNDENSSSH